LEAAGHIAELGPDVTGWSIGDRVAALLSGGGYATQVVCPASQLLPVPPDLSLIEAAALPEVLTTAHLNLVGEARLQQGERLLLHAGGSGVGTAAIQIAKVLGCRTFVVVGSDDKRARCVLLGAEAGANRHTQDWAAEARAWCGGKASVDVILDPVGTTLPAGQRLLAHRGRIIVIGLLGGRTVPLDLGRLLVKRQRIVGSVLRSRSIHEKAKAISGLRSEVWPHVNTGTIRPIIDDVLDIQQADAAHARLATNTTFGKLVLKLPGHD
jgi:NADPH:quinone reductase-like Zn-dependent oxidoreductase